MEQENAEQDDGREGDAMSRLYDAAKVAKPLPELWTQYGLPLKKVGGRFESSHTPCCKEGSRKDSGSLFIGQSGEWKWHCFKCGVGGSAIDLVVAMDGVSHLDAAKRLVADAGGIHSITGRAPVARRPRVSDIQRQAAIEKVIATVRASESKDPKVIEYLHEERCLSMSVINEAWSRGVLRSLPYHYSACQTWIDLNIGQELLREAGILKADRQKSALTYRPVVFLPYGGQCAEFRISRREADPNSPKALQYGIQTYPLVWQPKSGKVERVMVVEGGIDMLSAVDLGLSTNTMILGILGVGAWQERWLTAIREKYPKASWMLAQDNNQPGEGGYLKLAQSLDKVGASWERLAPWGDGADEDWNDTLKAARAVF